MGNGGFRLLVTKGADQALELTVRKPAETLTTLGRREDRDLFFRKDLKISRDHASIEVSERGYVLTDQESTNGTRCNGARLKAAQPFLLQHGDEIALGPETVVRFELITAPTEPAADTPASQRGSRRPTRRRASRKPEPATPVLERRQPPRPSEEFGGFAVYESLEGSDTDRVDVAIDKKTDKKVALKRFTTRVMTRSLRKQILADTERARKWQHPNIVSLVDVGEEGGTLYVATSLVDGVALSALQDRSGRELDTALAAYIVREACRAIAYVHETHQGFVHSHLGPRSFVVGRQGEVALINFGMPPFQARLVGNKTPNRYQAHEGRRGETLGARSDVCSLGFILYELLKQDPIDPRDNPALLPDVDTIRPEVPADMSAIAKRATALRPGRRFSSVAMMADELATALASHDAKYGPEAAAAWMAKHHPKG